MRLSGPQWIVLLAGLLGLILAGVVIGGSGKRHQFEGQCQQCHVGMPPLNARFEDVVLKDQVDRLCARCHAVNANASHPVGVTPSMAIPLARYLDAEGRVTCLTCHDVHKEQRGGSDAQPSKGLLRGHVRGRAFCETCHRPELLGSQWQHGTSVPYAHTQGQLTPHDDGAPLDEYSAQCLSCHEGSVSQRGVVDLREGTFQHGEIGMTHPVGVAYPRGSDAAGYTSIHALPQGVLLFNGKVGCLSCHNLYSARPGLLAMDMTGSALCVACHRK
jgi:predicted CXXCH cytochrome family protein